MGSESVRSSDCFRRLEKSALPSILTQVFHPWWCETCRVIQQQFWMTECHIFRGGGQNILWPLLHIFGVKIPNPQDLRRCSRDATLQQCRLVYRMMAPSNCFASSVTDSVNNTNSEYMHDGRILFRIRPLSYKQAISANAANAHKTTTNKQKQHWTRKQWYYSGKEQPAGKCCK